jgi:hypothetical protein
MAPELSTELIEYLIKLGASGRYDECDDLAERFPNSQSGAFMRLAPQAWYDIAGSLSASQLVALIKTLTVVERRIPRCRAGSVSPVIWLFRKLWERSSDDLSPLIDWVLSHTENPYLPFGSSNYGARSLAEYRELSDYVAQRAKDRRAAEEQRLLDAKKRKAAEATYNLFGALCRRDEKAVAALLLRGADIYAANEHGQTAIEFARSLGLAHLLGPSPNEALEGDAANSAAPLS